jgi:hypothetical protein
MQIKIFLIGILLTLLLGAAFAFVGIAQAEERAITLPWSVIGSGGMGGSAGDYTINSTLGQPVTGVADAGGYHLTSGFWTEVGEVLAEFFNFLPLILR